MAIHDPSYFLTNFKGNFNEASTDDSGYGALPAVEQNQTYIAYFNAVATTSPELINQTALYIKYLIDKDGNITKPKSDNTALLNLYNNFESGKIVTILPQNATQTAANLIGDQTITDIGTIQPILITETGSGRNNFIPTMSFTEFGSILNLEGIPSFNFLAKRSANTTVNTPTTLPFNTEINDSGNNYNNSTYQYTIPFNTIDYGLELSFQVGIAAKCTTLEIKIQISTDGGSNWDDIALKEITPPGSSTTNVNLGSYQVFSDTRRYIYVSALGDRDEDDKAKFTTYHYVTTLPRSYNTSNLIRVRVDGNDGPNSATIYGPPATTETYFTVTSNYTTTLQTTSSYWSGATYPTDDSPQWLTASKGLSSFINTNYIQLTPTQSLSMSFSNIITPVNILPGDYIRFEYDPSKQAKIYNVGNLSDGRVTIQIHPSIPTGSKLDHFVIYRVVKDANYLIVNQLKSSGANLTGFLQPKHISQELKDNLNNIIVKLESDGSLT